MRPGLIMNIANKIHNFFRLIPSPIYLGIAVLIFAASNSITRKIVEIGQAHAIVGKLQLQSIPLGIFSIYRNIMGTVIFFLLANLLYGPNHFAEVLSPFLWQWMIVYAAIIVVTGQLCWLAGLKKATSTELNLASLLNPIAAIVMAYLILGESPTLAQYLGGSLLLVGIIFGFIGHRYEAKVNRKLVNLSPRDAMEMPIGFRGV